MEVKTKVLVVGGGPAGATAASALAEEGIDTVLLERDFSSQKPCGGGIPSGVLDEFVIPAEQVKKHVYKIRFVSPTGDSIEIDLFPDYIAIVDRKSFDSMLRDKAKTSGAQLTGGLFINAEKGRKWYSCRIKSRNEELVCRAEYIIAADGVNSRVRLTQGLPLSTAFYTITERMKGVSSDTCEFWFSTSHAQGFYSWAFPSGEGICIGTGSRETGKTKRVIGQI